MGDPPAPSTWCCELGSVQDPLIHACPISASSKLEHLVCNSMVVTFDLDYSITAFRFFFLFCEALCNFILRSKIQMNKSHDLTWGFTLFCHLQWGLSRVCVRVQHVNGTFLSSSLSPCHAENTKSTYFEQKKKLQKVFQLTAACFHSMLWFTLCVEVCWLFPSRLTVFKNWGFVLASKKKKDSHYLVNVFFFCIYTCIV